MYWYWYEYTCILDCITNHMQNISKRSEISNNQTKKKEKWKSTQHNNNKRYSCCCLIGQKCKLCLLSGRVYIWLRRHDGANTLIWSIASPINCTLISFYGQYLMSSIIELSNILPHIYLFMDKYFFSFLIPPFLASSNVV